jgi:hypothetical protein
MTEASDSRPHVFPEGRKPGEILFCTLFLAAGGLLLLAIGWQTSWLPGKGLAAQPRFWPALSLSGLILFSGLNWLSRRKVKRTPGRWREAATWLFSLEYIAWYMAYVWAIPLTGYLTATLIFCPVLTYRLGYRGRNIWLAAGFGLFVVLFFKSAMNVKIPGGAIYELAPEGIRYILLRYF